MRWAAFLSGVALISAILVVVVRHQNRLEFLQVRAEEDLRDELNDEWSRLQLDKATWARHNLVEEAARNELGMVTPGPADIVVIQLGAAQ